MDNKARILQELLQGERSTGDLCKAFGYTDKKGVPRYSFLQDDLSTLYPKYLSVRTEKTGGRPGKFYSIKDDLTTYREIWQRRGGETLQEPIRKLPRVSDLLVVTWRDQYGLYKEWPEREGRFRLGLSVSPTFFKWHIEIDPFDSTPLSIKGQEEWYRLSGEGGYFKIKTQAQEEEYFTPHAIIDTLIYRALFVDYTEGQLTERGKEFLKADREEKERARRLVECNAKAQQVFSFLLDPTVPPLFKPEVAKELREMAQEWQKGLFGSVKQKGYRITKGLEYTCDKGRELVKRFPAFASLL